jgi:hypothetical protein
LRSLQGIDPAHEILVTSERDDPIRDDLVLGRFVPAHFRADPLGWQAGLRS